MAAFAILAVIPPIMVPIAAQSASPNNVKTHKANSELSGNPTNTEAAATVEKANGQIRRGLGFAATAATTKTTNATSALNGKTRITEKSMPEAFA